MNNPRFQNIKNILVIKFRHIGDVLLIVPALRALKETFPEARLSVAVNEGTEDVLSGNPLIDDLIVFDREIKEMSFLKKYINELSFLRKIRKQNFNMTVDLTGGDRAAILSFFSGARYRLAVDPGTRGFPGKRLLYTHLSEIDIEKHMVIQNLDVVRKYEINTDILDIDFCITEGDKLAVENIFRENNIMDSHTVVHVHPTARWMFKCWKDEYMAEVISWLIGQGIKVLVTSAPNNNEIGKVERILSLVSLPGKHIPGLVSLVGKTAINQLAAISRASDLFFGVDSAPMHIAAAVNVPVIALFGPSRVNNWGPWTFNESKEQPYPEKNGIQIAGIHTVIQRNLECIPCSNDGCEGSKKSRCLYDIGPSDVIESIKMKLKEIKQ